MLAIAALSASVALLIFAIALLAWVVFSFQSTALQMGLALIHELRSARSVSQIASSPTSESLLGSQLKQFIADRMKPTDGGFEVNSDEELYLAEVVKKLRDESAGGITDVELEAFVRQSVTEKG